MSEGRPPVFALAALTLGALRLVPLEWLALVLAFLALVLGGAAFLIITRHVNNFEQYVAEQSKRLAALQEAAAELESTIKPSD